MEKCDGYGWCFQSDENNEFSKNPNCVCEHKCGLRKCPNNIVCNNNTLYPEYYLLCHNGLCVNCAMIFGTKLKTKENVECSICLEDNCVGILQLQCTHYLCVECFKKCYLRYEEYKEPDFPYLNIENEYYEDQDNPKWERDYPLIKIYKEKSQRLYEEQQEKIYNNQHLARCPLCRK